MKTEQEIKEEIDKCKKEYDKISKLPDDTIVNPFDMGLPRAAKEARKELLWTYSTLEWILK